MKLLKMDQYLRKKLMRGLNVWMKWKPTIWMKVSRDSDLEQAVALVVDSVHQETEALVVDAEVAVTRYKESG